MILIFVFIELIKEIKKLIKLYIMEAGTNPIYVKHHPFRFVNPYEYTFETRAKQRWFGKPLLPTLSKQFKAYDEQYFASSIENKNITINKKATSTEYKIKNGDLLTHKTIREQPPILDLPIRILHQDNKMLVVEKPPSMIVHTGGGYHYNTVLSILEHEMGIKQLFVLHRLDRLTSGLLLLGKNKDLAEKFHEESSKEVMKKMYYARVSGDVGFEQKVVQAPIICLSHKQGIFSVYNHETMADKVNKHNSLKPSTTKLIKVWYDEQTDSSLLECYPITGRTHQIRVHLQYLGHSIWNDVVYGGKFIGNGIIRTIAKPSPEQPQKKIKPSPINNIQKWDYTTKPWQICLHSYSYIFDGVEYKGNQPYWCQRIWDKKQQQI